MSSSSNGRPGRRYSFWEWCMRYFSINALVIIAALVYVLFINENSVKRHYTYEREIADLTEQIRRDTDSLRYYRELNSRLDTDRGTMEMIVREQYHMQRPDEDIYIIKKR